MPCSVMKPSQISTNRRQPPYGKNVGSGDHSQKASARQGQYVDKVWVMFQVARDRTGLNTTGDVQHLFRLNETVF